MERRFPSRLLLEKDPISKLCDELGFAVHSVLPVAEGVLLERAGGLQA
jgi:hypothetical protein